MLLALSVAGCDSNDENDSDFELLRGSWTIQRVSEGSTTYNIRCDETSITFFEQENGTRRFLLRRQGDDCEAMDEVEGNLDLQTDDSLFLLSNEFQNSGGVRLDYRFDATTIAQLITTSTGGGDFVFFLTGIDLGRDVEDVVVRIERDGSA